MCAKNYRDAARAKLTGKWGVAIVCTFIVELLIAMLGGNLFSVNVKKEAAGGFYKTVVSGGSSLLLAVGVIVMTGPLWVGLASVFLRIVRGSDVEVKDIFDGFETKKLTNNIVTYVLVVVYTFLWTLLFIIPGIVKSYAYAMTPYILNDNPELSREAAITKSREMMNGNKWKLFCLHFSFIGWLLLCGLTFGILIVYVAPYMSAAQAEFYENLKNSAAPEAAPVQNDAPTAE